MNDEIARLRHEAKHLRQLAKARRADIQTLRALPMGQRDPIEQLRAQFRVNEYTMAARKLDAQIKTLQRLGHRCGGKDRYICEDCSPSSSGGEIQ